MSILYTRRELEKLHLQFAHHPAERLFQALRRSKPDLDNSVRDTLNQITVACDLFQEYHSPPFRFRATLPSQNVVFIQEVSIDLMWLVGDPVVHVVDTNTGFQNAVFIENKTSEKIWEHFVHCWASTYVGYPNRIRLDQEMSFISEEFRAEAQLQGIELQFSGIEGHNAIGSGETYNHPLRRIYSKLKSDHPSVSKEYRLWLAIKAMNDTAGTSGLSTSLLVYGIPPSFPVTNRNLPKQAERMPALCCAQLEMATIRAEERIRRALASKLPPATRFRLEIGDPVRVFREGSRKWEGPFQVERISKILIWVSDSVTTKPFSIMVVIPAGFRGQDRDLDNIISDHATLQQLTHT